MLKAILDEPLGSEITILSVQRYAKWKHRNVETRDALFIVYKDANNRKRVKTIYNPKVEIYFVKPEFRTFYTPREYLPLDQLYSVVVPNNQVLGAIYKEICKCNDSISLAYKRIYDQAVATGNFSGKKEIFKWPYTLMSDLNIEDYYMIQLKLQYNTGRAHQVSQAFLDIENDVEGLSSTEISTHEGKTNACSIVFTFPQTPVRQCFTFLLRDHTRYPQQASFEKHVDDLVAECHRMFDKQTILMGGKDPRDVEFPCDYHILFYDTEEQLETAIFQTVNRIRPDVCSIFNIGYDLPVLRDRAEYLGMDYRDLICDSLYPADVRFYELNIDNRPVEIFNRKTNIHCSSTTIYNDSMQSYQAKRKGSKAKGSASLDNTCKNEMGLGKLPFDPGTNVVNIARKNYFKFVLYSITDAVRTAMLEMVTNDVVSMIVDMNQSCTVWENLFKQTRYLRQVYSYNYLVRGYAPGNNPNVNYLRGQDEDSALAEEELKDAAARMKVRELRKRLDKEAAEESDSNANDDDNDDDDEDDLSELEELRDEVEEAMRELGEEAVDVYRDSIEIKHKVTGAIIGNPDLNSNNGAELFAGIHSKNVFPHVIDFDYKSEYPWAEYTRSISRSTQIGRLIIPKKISDRQNSVPAPLIKRDRDKRQYIPGAEFVSDFISGDILSFANVWFNEPSVEEMNAILMEELARNSKAG